MYNTEFIYFNTSILQTRYQYLKIQETHNMFNFKHLVSLTLRNITFLYQNRNKILVQAIL